ncbi:aminoglycoside 6-adenylyltransferase [Chitinophaga sp. Mgbs1]|uniref:Aminoglycoside 6-adenylyltransferase n=1 Tax=Chitinophaga solisilvae TaxID=1233460 RepID=A0A433WL61_9BACT|nr:aminoglycoside 6-adenylyltransferase [Chitinophaga solisilvae]
MIPRTEKLQQVIAWGAGNETIRAMLLTSSLTNPHAPVDMFSDLDIDIVVPDLQAFLADDSWLTAFGPVITTIVENEEVFDGRHASRMVIYEDYTKIDFLIYSVEKFREQASADTLYEDWDIGYEVLLDKDRLTAGMQAPTHRVFNIRKPSQEEFAYVFNDFLFCTTYVAKCLWRDELFYARFVAEQIMRFESFQKMIEWYIGSQHNWNVSTNKYGRLFKRYLSPGMWKKIEATFAGADIAGNWNALFAYVDVAGELGRELAQQLGYSYPDAVEEKIRKYLLEVKKMGARQ